MAVLASTIIARVRRQLVDEKSIQHWSDTELLGWISDGQRAIMIASPSLNEVTQSLKLDAGTRQTLPAGAHILLSIKRNMGTDGLTPGRAIRVVAREVLDTMNPDWHSAPKVATVENYVYDPEQQVSFYVYPPSNGNGYIEASFAKIPSELSASTNPIEVSDIFQTALFDYVMFRAHQKDSDYSAGDNKAQMYLQLFTAFIGQQNNTQVNEDPNTELGSPDLSSKGGAP